MSAGSMLIIFSTDSSITKKGFSATYRVTSCGGIHTDSSGVIHTPTHPGKYLNNMRCSWTIIVAENRSIELSFDVFDIEAHHSCIYDYVEVRDGPNNTSPVIGRYCGAQNPPLVKSKTNAMSIAFVTDGIDTFTGFRAVYRTTYGQLQGCGGFVNASVSEVRIASLDFDGNGFYEPDLNCAWDVMGADEKVLVVYFDKFDIYKSPSNRTECPDDYLEIFDGLASGPLIDRFCGQSLPQNLTSSGNKLRLHFHTESRRNGTGFQVVIKSVDALCGGTLHVTEEVGTLQSPGYPDSPPPVIRCTWMIQKDSSPSYRSFFDTINITFLDVDMTCGKSYLELQAQNEDSPYRICQPHHPHEIISHYPIRLIYASSAENARGFKLAYSKAGCNRTYTRDNGIIKSPTSYIMTTPCEMTIQAPQGFTVSLYFRSFHFYSMESSSSCGQSRLQIRDGKDITAPVISILCGNYLPPPTFSSGNALHISTVTASAIATDFELSYTTTDQGRGCGGNLTHSRGTFTSPLYPLPYNEVKQCYWRLRVTGDHTMTLKFEEFELNSTHPCTTNYVDLFEGEEETDANFMLRYCGESMPAPYQSQGNVLLVKLVTGSDNTGSGFKASFKADNIEVGARNPMVTSSEGTWNDENPDIVYFDYDY